MFERPQQALSLNKSFRSLARRSFAFSASPHHFAARTFSPPIYLLPCRRNFLPIYSSPLFEVDLKCKLDWNTDVAIFALPCELSRTKGGRGRGANGHNKGDKKRRNFTPLIFRACTLFSTCSSDNDTHSFVSNQSLILVDEMKMALQRQRAIARTSSMMLRDDGTRREGVGIRRLLHFPNNYNHNANLFFNDVMVFPHFGSVKSLAGERDRTMAAAKQSLCVT